MLIFKNEKLRVVIAEAIANKCKIALVKDQGVYFLSEKGEMENGERKHICYAEGCNPSVDAEWYETGRDECGGDDFVERFDPTDAVFTRVQKVKRDLQVDVSETSIGFSS